MKMKMKMNAAETVALLLPSCVSGTRGVLVVPLLFVEPPRRFRQRFVPLFSRPSGVVGVTTISTLVIAFAHVKTEKVERSSYCGASLCPPPSSLSVR